MFSLFIFPGHSTREPASSEVTYFNVLAIANTGEIGRGFGKNAGEWTGRVEISKEEISGSKRSMYGYILTYSRLKGRTIKLCVLTRWDLNFCVRSSPLRGYKGLYHQG